MATYLIVNVLFAAAVFVGLYALRKLYPRDIGRVHLATLICLVLLTAVFDSLIVGMDIVGYDTSKILGVYIGHAPIEDFFYALLAVIIVPTVWQSMRHKSGAIH